MIYFNGREYTEDGSRGNVSCYSLDDSNTMPELQNKLEKLAIVFEPHDEMVSGWLVIRARLVTCSYKLRVFATSTEIRERSVTLGKAARRFSRMSGQKKFSKTKVGVI